MKNEDKIQALRARMWRNIKFILEETEEKIVQLQNENFNLKTR